MGLFSKLKNRITGGWADVTLSMPEAIRGDAASVTVNVSVKSEPIDISEAYLILRCDEVVELRNQRVRDNDDEDDDVDYVNIHETEELFEQKFSIAPAQSLDANGQYTFEAEIDIPDHVPPTYNGRNSRIEWSAFAGLDMPGNDPDGGWQTIVVS